MTGAPECISGTQLCVLFFECSVCSIGRTYCTLPKAESRGRCKQAVPCVFVCLQTTQPTRTSPRTVPAKRPVDSSQTAADNQLHAAPAKQGPAANKPSANLPGSGGKTPKSPLKSAATANEALQSPKQSDEGVAKSTGNLPCSGRKQSRH